MLDEYKVEIGQAHYMYLPKLVNLIIPYLLCDFDGLVSRAGL